MKTALSFRPSRVSTRINSPLPARAFTLIEIMVVVAIIGLVMLMGVPAIYSTMHRDPLTQAVVDVNEACRRARAQAIMSGNTTAVHVFPRERRITVDAPPPPAPSPDSAMDQSATNAPQGFSAEISDRVRIEMLDVNFLNCLNLDMATVYFNANGTCDEFNIILHEDTGEARRIALDITTATPDVTPIQ